MVGGGQIIEGIRAWRASIKGSCLLQVLRVPVRGSRQVQALEPLGQPLQAQEPESQVSLRQVLLGRPV